MAKSKKSKARPRPTLGEVDRLNKFIEEAQQAHSLNSEELRTEIRDLQGRILAAKALARDEYTRGEKDADQLFTAKGLLAEAFDRIPKPTHLSNHIARFLGFPEAKVPDNPIEDALAGKVVDLCAVGHSSAS